MKRKKTYFIIGGSIILIILSLSVMFLQPKQSTMTYNDFLTEVQEKNVNLVQYKNEMTLVVTLKDGSHFQVPNPMKEDFKEFLLLNDIEVKSGSIGNFSGTITSFVIILGVLGTVFFLRKDQGAKSELIVDSNRSKGENSNKVLFTSIAGNDEAKEMAGDIVGFLMNPERYEKTGARMPRGVLLYGLPGTGKTLMAKAIAGEADVPFYAMSGSDFVQMYVGVGANRVRQLFKKARQAKRAVIFIDEIDALGKTRSGQAGGANDEREQTLNALLTEMSGFHTGDGIVVIGATNRVDTLDAALLRPGRFDRHIEVALPEQTARKQMLELFLKDKPLAEDVNIERLSSETTRFSGAMLENLVNEAAILAANESQSVIYQKHLETALYQVIAGAEKKTDQSKRLKEDLKITAYHEAGHALITKTLMPEVEIARISIIPTTKGAAGYNFNIYEDKMFMSKNEILRRIQVLLGGRIAEEIAFGPDRVTTGAINDIQEASRLLYDYFSKFGMDEEQGLFFLDSQKGNDARIYERCSAKMKELYEGTKALMWQKWTSVETITNLLLERESISGSEISSV